ncbi:unnamed protein product, partial [marine sediment metagenome]
RKFLFKDKDRIICNTGCITRYEADKYSMEEYKPGFYLYDTEEGSIEWIKIPHEKANKVLTRKHIEKKKQVESMLDDFIEMIEDTEDGQEIEEVQFIPNLIRYCKKKKTSDNVLNILEETIDEEVLWKRRTKFTE